MVDIASTDSSGGKGNEEKTEQVGGGAAVKKIGKFNNKRGTQKETKKLATLARISWYRTCTER